MISIITKSDNIVIVGDITKKQREFLDNMCKDGKTIEELKLFLTKSGHSVLSEDQMISNMSVTLPLEEEEELKEFCEAFTKVHDVLNEQNKDIPKETKTVDFSGLY